MKAIRHALGAVVGLLLLAMLTLLSVYALPSRAEAPEPGPQCAPFAVMQAELARDYDEHVLFYGRAAPRGIVAIFANAAGTTWTAAYVEPDGTACIVAVGQTWQPDNGTEG